MVFRRFTLLVCLIAAMPALALVQNGSEEDPRAVEFEPATVRAQMLQPSQATELGRAATSFLDRRGGAWTFRVDPRTERAIMAQGSGVPVYPGRGNELTAASLDGLAMAGSEVTPAALEPLIRSFVERHSGLLAPPVGELVFNGDASSVRANGRLASLRYDWKVNGVPVEGARVFVRLNSGNITQFGAPLVGSVEVSTTPSVAQSRALEILMKHSGDLETHRLQGEPELILQPASDGIERLSFRLVWKFTYTVPDRLETWEGRIDAHSGALIGFRDTNHYARVTGGVYPRTVFDGNETVVPFPFTDVTVDGSPATTDEAGRYLYGGGAVSTGLNGAHVNTNCDGCNSPSQPAIQRETGIGLLGLGTGGQDETGNGLSTAADRNTFFHVNQVRRIGLKWLPGESWFNQILTSNVNIDSVCNAVYSSGANSINMFRSGGGCNNTGEIADVIHHEWGHGLDIFTNAGDGASSEGTADVVAMHMSQSPLVGPGFNVSGNPVRNIDKEISSRGLLTTSNIGSKCPIIGTGGPLGYQVHCEGEIYGQTSWDLAQALVAKYGYHTGWRTSERIFFTAQPDMSGYHPTLSAEPAWDAYLQADDDDGNLANGTPNYQEIFDAFDLHGIAGAPASASAPCSRPVQPTVNVTPGCDSVDLSWNSVPGATQYEILRGEVRLQQAFFPVATVGSGTTAFNDPDIAPGVDYWYTVMAVDGAGCESTVESPVATNLTAQPVLSISAAIDDDTPMGNRSGFADPAEDVDVVLTLTNLGEIDASSITGTVVPVTPGVTMLESATTFAAVPVNGEATNDSPIRFNIDDQQVACGDVLRFQFIPSEASGCSDDISYFEVQVGEFDGNGFVCDPTPACFVKPDFDGLDQVNPGSSCAETSLSWATASTNCINATITYNVYRSTDPGLVPGPANLLAEGVSATVFTDTLLAPGQQYHYVVRAYDSRSGEEANVVAKSVISPTTPDLRAPIFGGIDAATSGSGCGETVLSWQPALETCSLPLSYEIYRSTDPLFVPSPATLIGSSLSPGFADAALTPGQDYTYIVRARDGVGNEDNGEVRFTTTATALDLVRFETDFEASDASWALTTPNDATAGNWEYGDPETTSYQTGDDATPGSGVNCWVTGLSPNPSNGDVDGGSTTLVSPSYNLAGTVDPAVRYYRYFNNDKGASPNDASDTFKIEVSNNGGASFVDLEPEISCPTSDACPLEWQAVEIPLAGIITPSNKMRFRFTARDLGDGSLVEAGIDEFELVDLGQGCADCAASVPEVAGILVGLDGDDVVLDWTGDAVVAPRFSVYKLGGSDFTGRVKVGTTDVKSFNHAGAAAASEDFYYRVSVVDACGNEGEFSQPLP